MRFYRTQSRIALTLTLGLSLALVSCGKKNTDDEEEAAGGNGTSNSNPTGGGSTGRVPTGTGQSVDLALYGSDGEAVISTMRLTPGQLTSSRSTLRYAELKAADLEIVTPLLASYVFPSQPKTGKLQNVAQNLATSRTIQGFAMMGDVTCESKNLITEATGDTLTMVTDFDSKRDCTPAVSKRVLAYVTESLRCNGADFTAYKGKSFSNELLQKEVTGCERVTGFGTAHSAMQVTISPTKETGIVKIQQITQESQGLSEKTCMASLVQETPDFTFEKQEACSQTFYIRAFEGKAADFNRGALEVLIVADAMPRSVGLLQGAEGRQSFVYFNGSLNLGLNGWSGVVDYESQEDYSVVEFEMKKGDVTAGVITTIDQVTAQKTF